MAPNAKYQELLGELAACAHALGEYREDVVVSGGLAPLLYRFHPDFEQPRQSPMLTTDLDIAVPESIPVREGVTLRERLEKGEFVIIPGRGTNRNALPKHFFQHRSRGTESLAAVHGEFLTYLKGSATDREGNPRSPRQVQEGLNAEALRFMELLLWQPLELDLSVVDELAVDDKLIIRLPRPGAYVVQKALSSVRRNRREKRDKDLAYIYDVATLTHSFWDELREEIEEIRRSGQARRRWVERAVEILHAAFIADDASGTDRIVRVYGVDEVKPVTVGRVLRRFLEEIGLR